jgi:hypothetical protein
MEGNSRETDGLHTDPLLTATSSGSSRRSGRVRVKTDKILQYEQEQETPVLRGALIASEPPGISGRGKEGRKRKNTSVVESATTSVPRSSIIPLPIEPIAPFVGSNAETETAAASIGLQELGEAREPQKKKYIRRLKKDVNLNADDSDEENDDGVRSASGWGPSKLNCVQCNSKTCQCCQCQNPYCLQHENGFCKQPRYLVSQRCHVHAHITGKMTRQEYGIFVVVSVSVWSFYFSCLFHGE